MSSEYSPSPKPDPGSDEFQKALGDYLTRIERDGSTALDEFQRQHPEFADRLGRQLGWLNAHLSCSKEGLPEHIGPYRVIQHLGTGGMGEVYLAEQSSPFQRIVALKVIRTDKISEGRVARFLQEIQTLARLSHDGIAKVFEAGQDADRPYFTMEYVPGRPVTDYCSEERLGLRARLRLFTRVCAAVEHAHRHGVLHRDLKPSNILVLGRPAESTIKIIDFGLAKIVAVEGEPLRRTITGQVLGTPDYMSPEAVAEPGEQPVDTRTDVYSLGVVLYELLTGVLPLSLWQMDHNDYQALLRTVRERQPSSPSVRVEELSEVSPSSPATGEGVSPHRLSRLLAGDLDAIVMKALAKDAAQRYGSVGQLADDIRRHLHNEPVGARPLTAGYALAKFARRHRIGTAFTATVTTVAFIALIVINALAHQAAHEAMRAKWLKGILRPLLSFDESDFLDTRREDLRLPQLLAKCVDLVEAEPPADPKTEAEIREILGLSYRALGQYRDAERQMDRVYEICEGELGPASERLLDVKLRYAVVIEDVGREEEAGRMLQEVYEARRLTLGAADPALLRAALMLVVNLKKRNLVAECQSLAEQTLATALEAGHRDSEIVGELEERLAWCHAGAYRDDTETLYQDAIRIARLRREPNDGKVLRLQNNLADFYLTMDRAAEAEPLLQRAWAAVEVQSGRTHPRSSLTLLSNIAKCRYYLGDFAGAETLWGEVAEGRRRAATDRGDPELLKATFYHCIALNKLGRRDEAERQLRPAILLADNHKPIKALLCNALGNVLLDSGHTHEAVDELTNALSIGRGSIRDPIGLANLESDTANTLLVAGERDRPRELVSAALGRLEGKLPDKHRTMVKVREILARADQVEPKENK